MNSSNNLTFNDIDKLVINALEESERIRTERRKLQQRHREGFETPYSYDSVHKYHDLLEQALYALDVLSKGLKR